MLRMTDPEAIKREKVKFVLIAVGVVAGVTLVGVALWKSGQLFPETAEVVGEVVETVTST